MRGAPPEQNARLSAYGKRRERAGEADERDRTLRYAHDGVEQAFRGFDPDRYPVWRDWLAGAATCPRRAPVIERTRRAGVLDLPGALEGW